MASVTPKLRSRKLGAAIALDDFDKRLLNAMQGSFPIEPRPYASVAAALEVPEERVLARVGKLV
jgi:DNA-binding Lrp family transcriptional regulator